MRLRLNICTYLSKNIVFLNRAYTTRKYEQKVNWYLQKSKYVMKKVWKHWNELLIKNYNTNYKSERFQSSDVLCIGIETYISAVLCKSFYLLTTCQISLHLARRKREREKFAIIPTSIILIKKSNIQ